MRKFYSRFDTTKPLSPHMVIKNAGNHFYSIGLWQFMIANAKGSRIYFNPVITLICVLILIIRNSILINNKEDNKDKDYFIKMGDFSYFLNIQYQFNLFLILFYFIAIISQQYITLIMRMTFIRHIGKCLKGWLDLIFFIIGITDEETTLNMIKKSKNLLHFVSFNVNILPILGFAGNFIPLAFNCNYEQLVIYVIPWTLIYIYGGTFEGAAIAWQITYIYLICYYLKIKLGVIYSKII